MHTDGITNPDIKAVNFTNIMQGHIADRDTANIHGCKLTDRG